ncbi:MAG: hypothetical protein HRU19_05160 [Pseudobacteriovorax sp.]|nr:hypothetical protein [Pseudobacteriovorax sp.]
MRSVLLVISLWFASPLLLAQGFNLHDLPKGKSVTLPHPATTLVPLGSPVRLTATDRSQTLKLSGRSAKNLYWKAFTVAIYDQNSEKVRYIKVDPKSAMVYSFKNYTPIQIIPMANAASGDVFLRVESNKPLTIAR